MWHIVVLQSKGAKNHACNGLTFWPSCKSLAHGQHRFLLPAAWAEGGIKCAKSSTPRTMFLSNVAKIPSHQTQPQPCSIEETFTSDAVLTKLLPFILAKFFSWYRERRGNLHSPAHGNSGTLKLKHRDSKFQFPASVWAAKNFSSFVSKHSLNSSRPGGSSA